MSSVIDSIETIISRLFGAHKVALPDIYDLDAPATVEEYHTAHDDVTVDDRPLEPHLSLSIDVPCETWTSTRHVIPVAAVQQPVRILPLNVKRRRALVIVEGSAIVVSPNPNYAAGSLTAPTGTLASLSAGTYEFLHCDELWACPYDTQSATISVIAEYNP